MLMRCQRGEKIRMIYFVDCYSAGILIVLVAIRTASANDWPNSTQLCGAYCDTSNNQHDGWYCLYSYCCGTETEKYCCTDESQSSYSLSYDQSCQTWWYFAPWRLLAVLLIAMLISLVTIVACFCWRYYACSCASFIPCQRHRTAQSGDRTGNDHSETIDIEHLAGDFDPTSLFAFEPPAYETLPKDPPLYNEVFGGPSSSLGQDNLSFVPADEQAEDGATAPLTVATTPQQDPPPYAQIEISVIGNIYETLDVDTSVPLSEPRTDQS